MHSEGGNKIYNLIVIILAVIALILSYKLISLVNWYSCQKEQEVAYSVDLCGLSAVECEGENMEAVIRSAAKKYGVSEQLMLDLAYCESRFDPKTIGDGFMPKPSIGLFQINLYYHPEVTESQALDPVFSADWTAKQISEGRLHLWSCAKIIAKS